MCTKRYLPIPFSFKYPSCAHKKPGEMKEEKEWKTYKKQANEKK